MDEYCLHNICQKLHVLLKINLHVIIILFSVIFSSAGNSERLDEPHFGAKSLALQAYYRGSLDNITVMVINFKKKRALQKKYNKQKENIAAQKLTDNKNS